MLVAFLNIMLCKLVLIWVSLIAIHGQEVVTPDGPIKGRTDYTKNNLPYSAFYSIPFAKPPVGVLRFQAPQPVDPWTDVLDASVDQRRVCFQLYEDLPEETEDCLILNVFVPQNTNVTSFPVMVFIHGGGFVSGSGLTNGPVGYFAPNFLMQNDVIFVTLNYRLGVFGFFSSGDEVIPGNNGLKDQTLALKWIKRNIAAFGGDPDKMLIFGQSAGSASVGYHLLSPSSSGLFSSAILQSGTPLCPWAYQRNQTKISYKTASFIDPQFETSRDSKKLLEVLQGVEDRTIDAAALSYANWDSSQIDGVAREQLQQGFFFAPVTEVPNDNAFLTEYPYVVLEKGNFNKVPIMIGTDSEEGLMNLSEWLDNTLKAYDNYVYMLNPGNLHLVDGATVYEVANAIKEEYSPSRTFYDNKLAGIQYFTEQDFTKSIVKHAEFHSVAAPTYFYEFSYSGVMGNNVNYKYPGSGNVTHGEEMGYIFGYVDPKDYPESDQKVHERLLKLWINFATYSNPTPKEDEVLQNLIWPVLKPDEFQYVNILEDLVLTQGKPKPDRIAFWDSIYDKYGIKPFDTY